MHSFGREPPTGCAAKHFENPAGIILQQKIIIYPKLTGQKGKQYVKSLNFPWNLTILYSRGVFDLSAVKNNDYYEYSSIPSKRHATMQNCKTVTPHFSSLYSFISLLGGVLLLIFVTGTRLAAQLDLGEISNRPNVATGKKAYSVPKEKKKKISPNREEQAGSESLEEKPTEIFASQTEDTENKGPALAARGGPVFSHPSRTKYRIGLSLEARPNGECHDIFGSVPFPMDFPDQKVHIIEDQCSDHVQIRYRDLKETGCRQLLVRIRTLYAGEKAEAIVTVEVTRFDTAPPENPDIYVVPKAISREIKRYLHESPYIEITNTKLKKTAKNVVSSDDKDWRKAEKILRYVRENVKYKEALKEKPIRGAMAALETGEGDCEDMSALFIALCRLNGIPARTVRVPEHCWAEFYLEDSEKNGYWFPAQVAGNEPLGYLTDHRIILQKGDAFHVPESGREASRYVKELFTGKVKESGADPIHQFIREEIR